MSKVIQFPNLDAAVEQEYFVTLRTNRKGELVEAGIWKPDDAGPDFDKETSHLMFVAAWWFLRSYGVSAPDDPDRVLALVSIANGSRVNVFTPEDDHEDAFSTGKTNTPQSLIGC